MAYTVDKKGKIIKTSGFIGDLAILEVRRRRLENRLRRNGLPIGDYTEYKCITRDLHYARKLV